MCVQIWHERNILLSRKLSNDCGWCEGSNNKKEIFILVD
jgi:hypothetical protein